ncbi:MAG: response regulator transcription factor [Gammaproteobacteria bacterium]|nr:response regulator transcription factor [Gammaproteobacteria bacterium]
MVPVNQNHSVLLIEDHHDIADMVCEFLEAEGYTMDYAADGITGLHLAVSNQYDAIILDLNLPGMDGISLLENLRNQARSDVPVLILTAQDTLQNKITGLDTGADDYLVKPFEMRELSARIRSLVRRQKGLISSETLKVADLVFDTATMMVTRGDQQLKLTPIGMQILKILMKASPKVVSRRAIEREIWGDILPDSDTLRSHMYTLRKAVDKPFDLALLHTVQNSGYKLVKIEDETIRD